MADPVAGQSAVAVPAAVAGAAGAAGGVVGEVKGAAETGWFQDLPEGLRADPSMQAFKEKPFTAVVESHISAQKMIGGSIRIPGKDAKPEEVVKFREDAYTKLGRPTKPEEYKFEKPNVDGAVFDEKLVSDFLPVAHKAGLNSEQVQTLINWQADAVAKSAPNHRENYEKCMKNLKEGDEQTPGWGSTTDRYLAVANRTLETMFHPESVKAIVASGLGNDPRFVRSMYKLGKGAMEEGLVVGESEGLKDGRQGALGELEKIMGADAKHPYWDKNSPEHDAAVQKVLDLRRYAQA